MPYETIQFTSTPNGVATLTLNRPDVKNAMNGLMYDEARAVVAQVAADPCVRVLVLTGAGTVFCAGGDFKYQQCQAARAHAARLAEASKLALWLREIDRLPKPVIGRINGAAYGGGLGLVSVCDVSIAAQSARFCLSEVSLGLMPSMIAPYVVRKMGISNARSVFLNAQVFSARRAKEIGAVHEVVPDAELDAAVARQLALFLRCAPNAITATKKLVDFVASNPPEACFHYTVDLVAHMWSSDEAAEGIDSFLNKREPAWRSTLACEVAAHS